MHIATWLTYKEASVILLFSSGINFALSLMFTAPNLPLHPLPFPIESIHDITAIEKLPQRP